MKAFWSMVTFTSISVVTVFYYKFFNLKPTSSKSLIYENLERSSNEAISKKETIEKPKKYNVIRRMIREVNNMNITENEWFNFWLYATSC